MKNSKMLLAVCTAVAVVPFAFMGLSVTPASAEQISKLKDEAMLSRMDISLNQFDAVFNSLIAVKNSRSNIREYNDDYSGVYIDDEGYLNIGYVANSKNISTLAQRAIAQSNSTVKNQKINYVAQNHSFNYLTTIYQFITTIEGFNSVSFGINHKTNVIDFSYSDESDKKLLISKLAEQNINDDSVLNYISLESTNLPNAEYYPYPGTKISYNFGFLNTKSKYGTVGFCAYDNETGEYGVVTNAHVADSSSATYKNYQGKSIGKLSKSILNENIDAAFVKITNKSMRVTESIEFSDSLYYSIGNVASESIIIQGATVRKMGAASGDARGQIVYPETASTVNYSTGTVLLKNLIQYDIAPVGGDSGGPVVLYNANHNFLGIHIGGNEESKTSIACRASNILSRLNLSLVNQRWMIDHPDIWDV